MFFSIPRDEVLRLWLRAAEEFSKSTNPNVGQFAILTGRATAHADYREDLALAVHVVQEIAGARSGSNPDKVDRVLLRSGSITSSIWGHSEELLQECVKAGIIASEREARQLEDAISEAIARRRMKMGLRGRNYVYD